MKFMNKKLVLSCGALAVFGATSLQGCSSSDDAPTSNGGKGGGTAGTASGGKGGGTAGTASGGKGGGSAGTASGGKSGAGNAGSGTAGTVTAGAAGAGEGGAAGASELAGAGGTAGASELGGAAGSDAGAAGAGPVTQADLCTKFCADEATTCASNALMQYASSGECETDCLGYALGTSGMTSGNTLYCRIYHLGVAAGSPTAATTHCPHTGPNPTAFCIN